MEKLPAPQTDRKHRYTVSRFEVGARSLRAEELLDAFVAHLVSQRVSLDNVGLTGVKGTKRLLGPERTHGHRFITHSVPLEELKRNVANGEYTLGSIEHDPFRYADEASVLAPAIAVYDLGKFVQPLKPEAAPLEHRFHTYYGEFPDPIMYGVNQGNLDPVTRHIALLKVPQ